MSEKFNDFFVNIGNNLARKIPGDSTSPKQYLGEKMIHSILLEMVTTEEINKIVDSLKKGAPGYDEITVDTLRLSLDILNEPLCYLCNRSLIEGVFPNEMKLANNLPLFKSGDPMLFNNYRPVSLLGVLSKVFEKEMYSRLLSFIENHNLLFQYQFGFHQMHSSYMALMIMMDKITAAMDRGDLVVGIFLDFSSAFDTVNHEILIDKLYHYDIRGTALYLCNRCIYVTAGNLSRIIVYLPTPKLSHVAFPRDRFLVHFYFWYIYKRSF